MRLEISVGKEAGAGAGARGAPWLELAEFFCQGGASSVTFDLTFPLPDFPFPPLFPLFLPFPLGVTTSCSVRTTLGEFDLEGGCHCG